MFEPQRINPALADPISAPASRPARPAAPSNPGSPDFADALRQASSVKFSKHAAQRVQNRELQIDAGQLLRLSSGIDQAAAKNSRTAAVVVDHLAFVVGVPDRTVITAIDRSQMKTNVVTNIDAVVLA